MFNKIKAHTINVDELVNIHTVMAIDDRYYHHTTLNDEFDMLGLLSHNVYRSILDDLHNNTGIGVVRGKYKLLSGARPTIGTLQDFRGAFRTGQGKDQVTGIQTLYGYGCDSETADWKKIDLSEINSFDEFYSAFWDLQAHWSTSTFDKNVLLDGESIMVGCDIRIPNTDKKTLDIANGLRVRLRPVTHPMRGVVSYFMADLDGGGPHVEDDISKVISDHRGIIEVRFRMYFVNEFDKTRPDNKDISTLLTKELGTMDTVTGEDAFHRVKPSSSERDKVGEREEPRTYDQSLPLSPYEETLESFMKVLNHEMMFSSQVLDSQALAMVNDLKHMLTYRGLTSALERRLTSQYGGMATTLSHRDTLELCNGFNMSVTIINKHADVYLRLQFTETLAKNKLLYNSPPGSSNKDRAKRALVMLCEKQQQQCHRSGPVPSHPPATQFTMGQPRPIHPSELGPMFEGNFTSPIKPNVSSDGYGSALNTDDDEVESIKEDHNTMKNESTRYHFVTADFGLPLQGRVFHYCVDVTEDDVSTLDRDYWLTEEEAVTRLTKLKDFAFGTVSNVAMDVTSSRLRQTRMTSTSISLSDKDVIVLTLDEARDMTSTLVDIYENHFGVECLAVEIDNIPYYCYLNNTPTGGYRPETITIDDLTRLLPYADVSSIDKATLFNVVPGGFLNGSRKLELESNIIDVKEMYRLLVLAKQG